MPGGGTRVGPRNLAARLVKFHQSVRSSWFCALVRPTVRRVNVLFVSSEVTPFAKTGGLGDVAAALPRVLATRGHDVRIVLPMYPRVQTPDRKFERVVRD